MTELPLPSSLRREFRHRVEAELHQRLARKHQQDRDRRERRARAENEADDLVDLAVAALTDIEIATFTAELDTYDEATVFALQENAVALDAVRQHLDDLLAEAHVLPDGRRVFKTEDGLRVFDEHGAELEGSVIGPNEISDSRPTWEMYQPFLEEEARLRDQRTALLDYQTKLDEARERLDSGDMTRDEYDELRANLSDTMPDIVRDRVDGIETGPDAKPEVKTTGLDVSLDLADDMVPTFLAPPQI